MTIWALSSRLRVVSFFPLGDDREMRERAKRGARTKKSERGQGRSTAPLFARSLISRGSILDDLLEEQPKPQVHR